MEHSPPVQTRNPCLVRPTIRHSRRCMCIDFASVPVRKRVDVASSLCSASLAVLFSILQQHNYLFKHYHEAFSQSFIIDVHMRQNIHHVLGGG